MSKSLLYQNFFVSLHHKTKQIKIMAVININIGKDDVLNLNVVGTSQSNEVNYSKEVIYALYKKLKADLIAYNNKRYKEEHKHWWYEVFIDFDDDFDECIYPKIKDIEYDGQYTFCLGYMFRRDEYYFSPNYYKSMNAMVAGIKEEDFNK